MNTPLEHNPNPTQLPLPLPPTNFDEAMTRYRESTPLSLDELLSLAYPKVPHESHKVPAK